MLNSYQTKLISSVILATMLGLSACSSSDTEDTTIAPETVAPESEESSEALEQESSQPAPVETKADPQQKLNAYIDCSNGTMSDLYKSFNRYEQWADLDSGPTGNESVILGIYSLNESSVEDCVTNAAAAIDMAPSLPELDKAVSDYVVAIQEYDDVSREADEYYEQGNYQDDGFALGKELHPQIISAFEKADTAAETFDSQLGDFNRKLRNEHLAQIEQTEGKKFNYYMLALSLKAEDMVNYITQESFDPEKAQSLIEEYESAADELNTYIETEADDVPATISMTDMFMDNLLVAAKNRMRHVRDGKEFTQAEIGSINSGSGWVVEGSSDRVIKDYNSLVEQLNRL